MRDLTPRLDGIEDPESEPASSDRGRALGLPGVAEDGKRFYFVARGSYPVAPSPEGQLPVAGSPNLYLAELDEIDEPIKLRFVATLGAGDEGVWQKAWEHRTAERLAGRPGARLRLEGEPGRRAARPAAPSRCTSTTPGQEHARAAHRALRTARCRPAGWNRNSPKRSAMPPTGSSGRAKGTG